MENMDQEILIGTCYEKYLRDHLIGLTDALQVKNIDAVIHLFKDCFAEHMVFERHAYNKRKEMDCSIYFDYHHLNLLEQAIHNMLDEDRENPKIWNVIYNFIQYWKETVQSSCNEIWLEFDNVQGANRFPRPCLFYDVSKLNECTDSEFRERMDKFSTFNNILLDRSMEQKLIMPEFNRQIEYLAKTVGMYQFGFLLSRGDREHIRIYTGIFERCKLKEVLNTTGLLNEYDYIMQLCDDYNAENIDLAFNYSIKKEQIDPVIGISIYYDKPKAHIDALARHYVISDEEAILYQLWNKNDIVRNPEHGIVLFNRRLGHLKLTIRSGRLLTVKSYFYSTQHIKKLRSEKES